MKQDISKRQLMDVSSFKPKKRTTLFTNPFNKHPNPEKVQATKYTTQREELVAQYKRLIKTTNINLLHDFLDATLNEINRRQNEN